MDTCHTSQAVQSMPGAQPRTTTVMLFLVALACALPAFTQQSKLSEADIRQEIQSNTYPLTVRQAPEQHKIPGRYIVLFKDSVADPHGEARDMVSRWGGKLHNSWGHAVKGFAATLTPEGLEMLRRDPRVALIEEDRVVHTAALAVPSSPQSPAPSWALDRIDQRGFTLDNSFSFPASGGAGVHIYMIDSGIMGGIFGQVGAGSHVEFAGRVGDGVDFVIPSTNGNDCLGHGTFGASLAAGTTMGVAKLATLHPVRVIDCVDTGSASGIIAGVNWVTSDHLSHPGQKSIANMSLTVNGIDTAVDAAVQNSINAGIGYTIAAGNSQGRTDLITGADLGDSCNLSPQRVGAALTIGAMDDVSFAGFGAFVLITTFSDFGGCVDLYAPGIHMTGAGIASSTTYTGPPFDGLNHLGTSWSAPLVAGVAAMYYGANPNANASQVQSAIVSNATINALSFPANDTPAGPNRLLYSDFQTDIQTTVSSNNGAPAGGSQFSYTFQVKNNGPFNSMDPVIFTDNLPAAVGGTNVLFSTGTCDGIAQITCNLGRLAVGQQATITVVVTAPFGAQTFTNTGIATLQSGQSDRAPGNNSASLTLTSH